MPIGYRDPRFIRILLALAAAPLAFALLVFSSLTLPASYAANPDGHADIDTHRHADTNSNGYTDRHTDERTH